MLGGLSYKPNGKAKDYRRIVIVDDTFTTGTTAAAIVALLRQHGLPEDCEVIVACPLWLDTHTLPTARGDADGDGRQETAQPADTTPDPAPPGES